MLSAAETATASQSEDMAGTARGRSNLHGCLAMVFREEPSSILLDHIKELHLLGVLTAAGVALGDDFLTCPEDQLREDLSVEYSWIFIGPGRHVAPFASVHLEEDGGTLWGRVTGEIKRFIESAGFEYRPEFHGFPDHISVALEFMEGLTEAEAAAWEENRLDDVSAYLETELAFLDRYLLTWVPAFCAKVAEQATLPFYREMAMLTADFLKSEQEEAARRIELAAA